VIAGIRADTSLDLRVSENTITKYRPSTDFQNPPVSWPSSPLTSTFRQFDRRQPLNDDNSPWEAVRIWASSKPASKLEGASHQPDRERSGEYHQ
jgi:hypothetical protein